MRRLPDAVDSARVLLIVVLGVLGLLQVLPGTLLAKAVAIEGVFLLGPILYAVATKLPVVDTFALRPPRLRVFAYGLAASVGSMWLLSGLTILQDHFFVWIGLESYARQSYDQLQKPIVDLLRQGRGRAFLLMSAVPGICEEFLFRGLVFRGFQRSFSPLRALAYTAVLFAAMHVEIVKIVPMLFLGFFFGGLTLLGRSLWMSVVAHMANNAAVLIVAEMELRGYRVTEGAWFLYPVSAIVFLLAMACLLREYRRGT